MTEVDALSPRRRNIRLINQETKEQPILGPIVGYTQQQLPSLLEACKPLIDVVEDVLHYASIALEKTPELPPDNLTHEESAAIRLYTMEWDDQTPSLYSVLNRTLRTEHRDELRPWFKYLALFLTALVKLPCAPLQIVWRGVAQDISAQFPPGTDVTWWSFSSCTTTLTVLENALYLGDATNRTLFSIEEFNARNISAHSYFATEDEILLLPGTYMEVRSQLHPTAGLHIIHLKQKIPEEVLLEPPFPGIFHWIKG
jgi:NAD:arginine ADP-ribosyltransferase